MNHREAFIFQHLLLSSSSNEESDDDNFRGPIILRPRIQNFVSDVVDAYSQGEFRENFRMFRSTFSHILSLIENKICSEYLIGRHPVPAKDQLLFTLWYFGTPDCYRSVCSRFNVGKATAIRTIRRVTEAILEMGPTLIKWPTGEYLQTVVASFNNLGFPNTIGALDGTHIHIPLPKEDGLSYINRKNFPSLVRQGVCDHRMLFTHCYVGEVGSTHDANVLKRSELINYMIEERAEKFENDTHLVADKAYPCLPTLMVPYRNNGHLTQNQRNFNYKLSVVRSIIERVFALLKKRFRCTKFFDIKNIEWACKYIMACCILHNICILQNDILEIDELIVGNEENEEFRGAEPNRQFLRIGSQKRDNLCALLNEQ